MGREAASGRGHHGHAFLWPPLRLALQLFPTARVAPGPKIQVVLVKPMHMPEPARLRAPLLPPPQHTPRPPWQRLALLTLRAALLWWLLWWLLLLLLLLLLHGEFLFVLAHKLHKLNDPLLGWQMR